MHASINCLVAITPALGEGYSGHQPPMFSPSAESVLSKVTFSSWKHCLPSKGNSSYTQDMRRKFNLKKEASRGKIILLLKPQFQSKKSQNLALIQALKCEYVGLWWTRVLCPASGYYFRKAKSPTGFLRYLQALKNTLGYLRS